ncbi:NAD(P)H-hydrate dehydratase [Planococcus halotolerans]|uniref:ADP-dependent (S)-NAD(P)H-hydrate dehydratase n=1 Tax=Planococcus halotolerans TaxID=2233542 RepID=A0A365L0K7_9BACL|nr:NAD(P)H-hydrate dehydratase [Planococcus halotolerans]QHJ71292.1 NAD(P)H-hydrate dehydratase [Planococcus halotolerans]RAZ78946.1 NAD(P)H-hydrate dehydratase [Planococcus halotolerans]
MDDIPVWSKDHVRMHLPQRQSGSHKGTYGTALLIAGSTGMPGAAVLAAKAAMRSGLGKLVVATARESITPIASHVPEATFEPELMERINDPELDLTSYKAIAIGPGMLPDQKTEAAVEHLLQLGKPLVMDAGALSERTYAKTEAPVILTPHPGEFSRITGVPVEKLQQQRAHHAANCAVKLGVTIVLKGQNTVIAFPDGETYLNATGNSALAKGGTGDTLTGMLLGMLCCHDNWRHAVLNAVHLHGACADEWIKTHSAHTLLAHELTELLPTVMKPYEQQ